MNYDDEIKEIKERLSKLENQHRTKAPSSSAANYALGFITVIVLILITIGVVHFISSSP